MMSGVLLQAQEATPVAVPILKAGGGFAYGYSGWQTLGGVQKKSAEGVTITGPAAGGAGLILNPPADISGATELVVKIKLGATNTANKVVLKFVDVAEWPISLGTVSATEFTEVKLPLTKGGQPIAVEKLKAIKNVQVQGDFNPTHTMDVTFASITATGPAAK